MKCFKFGIFYLVLAITSWEAAGITTRIEQRNPVRNFRRHVGNPVPADWELGLREAVHQALSREHYTDPGLRHHLLEAPLIGRQDRATPFGDVAVLARGQLYATPVGYQFVQDPYQNDCDGCHNIQKNICTSPHCDTQWTLSGQRKLLALWTVKRIRHRDANYGHVFELQYTISPAPSAAGEGIVYDTDGQFNYNIPGHVFVIKSNPRLNDAYYLNNNAERHKHINEGHPHHHHQHHQQHFQDLQPPVYDHGLPVVVNPPQNLGGHHHHHHHHPVKGEVRPGIVVGLGPDGKQHIIQHYPGYFPSQQPTTQHQPSAHDHDQTTIDPKEYELYKKLIDSLASKTNPPQNNYIGSPEKPIYQTLPATRPTYHQTTVPATTQFVRFPDGQVLTTTTDSQNGNVHLVTPVQFPTTATEETSSSFVPTTSVVQQTQPQTYFETVPQMPSTPSTTPVTTIHYFTPVDEGEGHISRDPSTSISVSQATHPPANPETTQRQHLTSTSQTSTHHHDDSFDIFGDSGAKSTTRSGTTKVQPKTTAGPPVIAQTVSDEFDVFSYTAQTEPMRPTTELPKISNYPSTTFEETPTTQSERQTTSVTSSSTSSTGKATFRPSFTPTTRKVIPILETTKFVPSTVTTSGTTTRATTSIRGASTAETYLPTTQQFSSETTRIVPSTITSTGADSAISSTIEEATTSTKTDSTSTSSTTIEEATTSTKTDSTSTSGRTTSTTTGFTSPTTGITKTTGTATSSSVTEPTTVFQFFFDSTTSRQQPDLLETTLIAQTPSTAPTTVHYPDKTTIFIPDDEPLTVTTYKEPSTTPRRLYTNPDLSTTETNPTTEASTILTDKEELIHQTTLGAMTEDNELSTTLLETNPTTLQTFQNSNPTTTAFKNPTTIPPTISFSAGTTYKEPRPSQKPTQADDFLIDPETNGRSKEQAVKKSDFSDDDIFGQSTTKLSTRPTEMSTKPEVVQSDLAEALFGGRRAKQIKVTSKLYPRTAATPPKVIYSNFYAASTEPVSTIAMETTRTSRENEVFYTTPEIQTTEVTGEKTRPHTEQSYITSISFAVNKKNGSTTPDVTNSAEPMLKARLKEVATETKDYTVYKAEMPETTEVSQPNGTKTTEKASFDDVALQLVNHARSLDYLDKKPSRQPKYRRRRYKPKSKRNQCSSGNCGVKNTRGSRSNGASAPLTV